MTLPKALFWGNTPFLVPRTEKNENGYDNEGLQDGLVYLTPVNGKKSKNGKPAYESNNFTVGIVQGYVKDEHIFFQPSNAGDFHGSAFVFNRPKDEGKEDKVKAQERLLGEWAKNYCVCVLDCREHHQLNRLAKDFDGWWLKTGQFMILTESTDYDKLPQNEKETYEWFVKQVKEENKDVDTVQEEGGDSVVSLIERGLYLPLAQNGERLYTVSGYRNIFNDEVLNENKPEGKPDLTKYAEVFEPPKQQQNSGGGYRGGGVKQVTPQERYEFAMKVLGESGFDVSNLRTVVNQAMFDTTSWYTLQLALSFSGTGMNHELPWFLQEENPEPEPEPKNDESSIDKLTKWCKERKDNENYFGQKLDKVLDGSIELTEEKADLLLKVLEQYDITKPDSKKELGTNVGKTLTTKTTVFDLTEDQLRKAIK